MTSSEQSDLDLILADLDGQSSSSVDLRPVETIDSTPYHGFSESIRVPWGMLSFVAIAAYFGFRMFSGFWSGDDTPGPRVDKPHVVILEESSQRENMTADQLAILTSVPLRKFYDENEVVYRKYDVQDDMSNETETLRELRNTITLDPPCVIVAKGSKATQFKLPENPELHQAKVKKLIGGK